MRHSNARRNTFNPEYFRLFDSFLSEPESCGRNFPAVNIHENEQSYLLDLSVPGFDKDNFSVELNEGILEIKGEKKEENGEENEKFSRQEFAVKSFSRKFRVPKKGIDETGIRAAYVNGILQVEIPKEEEEKKEKQSIKIE